MRRGEQNTGISILSPCSSQTQQVTLRSSQALLFLFCPLLVLPTQQQVLLGRGQPFLQAMSMQGLAGTIVL